MKDFMDFDFVLSKLVLACHVPAGNGGISFSDRASHGLAMHLGGEKVYTFSDGKAFTVCKNDIIFMPKHSTYTVKVISPGECYAINFDIPEEKTFSPFVVKSKNHTATLDFFKRATTAWQQKQKGYIMKCKAELYNVISTIQEERYLEYYPKNKLEIIRIAVDYIHENYFNESISVEHLSEMCGITPEYFRKIFKSFFGSSPISYINNLKITRAKELFESGMYMVREVAEASGYTDMSHFSREFKKATGLSPTEYAKRNGF